MVPAWLMGAIRAAVIVPHLATTLGTSIQRHLLVSRANAKRGGGALPSRGEGPCSRRLFAMMLQILIPGMGEKSWCISLFCTAHVCQHILGLFMPLGGLE